MKKSLPHFENVPPYHSKPRQLASRSILLKLISQLEIVMGVKKALLRWCLMKIHGACDLTRPILTKIIGFRIQILEDFLANLDRNGTIHPTAPSSIEPGKGNDIIYCIF